MNQMKHILLAASLAIILLFKPAHATKIEIALPELSGAYNTSFFGSQSYTRYDLSF